jgi:CBS domain-containing protein
MAIRVKDIMTRDVVTVSPDATLRDVAGLLVKNSVSSVPVRDADGQVVGIISERDLLRPFGKTIAQRRDWWISALAQGNDLEPQFEKLIGINEHRAALLMTKPVKTTDEEMELGELAEIMSESDIKRLPVLRDGRLVGIVSRADIVKAIAGLNAA